jgi:hypothetical protein
MKKIYFSLLLLSATLFVSAQNIVSTTPTGRNAVLEELTGVNCGNCPDGHVRANNLKNAYPNRVTLINIHAGSFANGNPDLKSAFGAAINTLIAPTGYPSGSMNRMVWAGAYNEPPFFPQNPPNNLAIRRPGWYDASYVGQTAGEDVILNGGTSVVNIGATSTYNSSSNSLDITVELYYTADETEDNKLNVAILQNGVVGYQAGGGASYTHNHILRDMLTGQWGEAITTTSQGSLITKTYNYPLPADYNGLYPPTPDDLEVTIFVTKNDNKTIHTGISIPANNGTSVGTDDVFKNHLNLTVYPNPVTNSSIFTYQLHKKANVSYQIAGLNGQIISKDDLGVLSPKTYKNQMGQTTQSLAPGTYVFTMQIDNQSVSQLITKQ